MLLRTLALPVALIGSAAAATETGSKFAEVADAVAAAHTCEQLGFTVDRAGIIALSDRTKDAAIAQGMEREQASLAMQRAVAAEMQRWNNRWIEARRMSHAPDNVHRYNRALNKRCRALASHALTSPYFTEAS